MKLDVLHEDNHLLVVIKPAGLVVQGDATGRLSLLDLAKSHRKEHEQKPGNVYVGLVHRLDEPVSGIIVLAKTSKAAARLSEQFRSRKVAKSYLAVVGIGRTRLSMSKDQRWETWEDEIVRQEDASRKARTQICRTRSRGIARANGLALLELRPITGRKHQLRVQTSKRGTPIVGDAKYGSKIQFEPGIALHAAAIRIEHPTLREPMTFVCRPPKYWAGFPFEKSQYQVDLNE